MGSKRLTPTRVGKTASKCLLLLLLLLLLIYIGQRFVTVPKDVRSNANFVIGFTQTKDDSDCFYNNVLSNS